MFWRRTESRDYMGRPVTALLITKALHSINSCGNIAEDKHEDPGNVNNRWSGHSRRSGAREWLRQGVGKETIKSLGRWGSDAIEAYLQGMVLEFSPLVRNNVTDNSIQVNVREQLCELSRKVSQIYDMMLLWMNSVAPDTLVVTHMPAPSIQNPLPVLLVE